MTRLSVEGLEGRYFLSVSGATLAFPLTPGGQWTTRDDDGYTDAYTVVGKSTFNGVSATKVQDTSKDDQGAYDSTNTSYWAIDGSKNFVTFGAVESNDDGTATLSYDPALIEYPASMTAGTSYRITSTLHGVDVDSDGTTTTADTNVSNVITLVSEKTQKVTVPAGTFDCYQLNETITFSNSKDTVTSHSTLYVAPGVFPVKEVDTSTDGDVSTTVLTSNNAKKTATQLKFQGAPSDGRVSTALSPAVAVEADDASGDPVSSDTSTVSLAIASGPSGGTLAGTATATVSNGVATFSNLKFSQPGTYTLRATDGTLDSAVSAQFKIVDSGPAKLAFATQPSSAQTGDKIAPAVTVDVENADGTVNTSDNSAVTLAIASGPVGAALGGSVTVSAVKGVATFSDLMLNLPGTYTLKATDDALTGAESATFTIISKAKASKLAFSQPPKNTVAGQKLAAVSVAVEYPGGAIVQNDASTVTLSLASGPGTLGGTLTAKAVNGVATFTGLLLTKAGTYTLKATDGTLTSATSVSFTITPAAAAKLAFAATPPATPAGKTIGPVSVLVQDAYGNTVTGDTSTVSLAVASGPGTLAGTVKAAAKAGVAAFSTLSINKLGTYTLKATDGKLTSATSGSFPVTAGAATKLVLVGSAPATVVAGKAISPALVFDIEDANGNVVTTDSSKVTLTVASGKGTVGGTATVSAKAGVATFSNVVLTTAGAVTLTASDGKLTAAKTGSITVTPGAASQLVFAAALPATVTAGKPISPSVAVDVEDAYGNLVTGDTSSVTLAVGTGPSGGTLGGTVKATAKAGIATFSGLSLTKAGAYTLKATDGKLKAGASSSLAVAAAAAAKLAFTQVPKSAKTKSALSPAVTVAVEDAYGNVVTTDKSKVTIALATHPSGSTLGGTASITAVSGVATFSGLTLSATGAYTLKATDGVLTSATSSSLTVA